MTKNFFMHITAMILCLAVLSVSIFCSNKNNGNSSAEAVTAKVRTVSVSINPEYDSYLTGFKDKQIDYIEEENKVSFYGVMDYNEDVLSAFDKVSLADEVDIDNTDIVYDCSFDMKKMQFTFIAMLRDENKEIIEIDEMVTDAFVTESGGLDAYIEIDGETYLLSDYFSTEAIDNCFFGWLKNLFKKAVVKVIAVVAVVVVVYVAVAEVAEQIKADDNLKYNEQLERNGQGVASGSYIANQDYGMTTKDTKYDSEEYPDNYYPADYRFGFTTFGGVGCEVASVYNLLIALNKSEMLSKTIYNFEKWAIEFAVGWGNLGSNPKQISKYLDKKGIAYTKITDYDSFKSQVTGKANCRIIMSRWNDPFTDGIHTFYIDKASFGTYRSYNWEYKPEDVKRYNIDTFNNGSRFIVGYII